MEHKKFNYKSLDELRKEIQRISPTIPISDNIDILFSPKKIGKRVVENRLVVDPMEGRDADETGKPTELTYKRYSQYARGGCGTIWFEGCCTTLEGRSSNRQLVLNEANRKDFAALLKHTKKENSDVMGRRISPLMILQLQDTGRNRNTMFSKRLVVDHNPYLRNASVDEKLADDNEIEELENTFIQSARIAYEIGFDGIDIKCCNGYFAADLLSARARNGRFGGDFMNRIRFLLDVVDGVREVTSDDFLITTRLGLYDGIPYPFGWGTGKGDNAIPDLEEPLELLAELEKHGVSLVSVSNGVPEISAHLIRPFNNPPRGGELPSVHPLESIELNVQSFQTSKNKVSGIVYVGSSMSWLRQFLPNVGAALIENGIVDMVGLGRMSFAYPDFAKDLANNGVIDIERVCVACTMCTQLLIWDKPTGCVVHNEEPYGRVYKEALKKYL